MNDDNNKKVSEEEKISEVSDTPEESAAEETSPEEVAKPEEATTEPEEIVSEETPESSEPETAGEAEANEVQSETPEPEQSEPNQEATEEKSEEQSESTEPEKAPEAAEEPSQEAAAPAKNDNPNAKWYVVHTYSGHENKVAHTLKQRVESEHLEEKILDVLVPTQDKIEIKGGKKVNIKEKIFPGYILVKMVLDDISWLAVRTTQGVTSFVGMGNKPTPISDAEVQTIVKFTQTEAPMYKQAFLANDTVKIVDGPFADFIGKIDSVDEERGKVKVLVSIFGRETPVELDFLQVQKL